MTTNHHGPHGLFQQAVPLMSKLLLIRHGQASLGQQDYDQLSPLGQQQARWLGEYFKESGLKPDRIITGRLKRQHQTAQGICDGLGITAHFEQHPGWDEFDFYAVGRAYLNQHPEHAPKEQTAKAFFALLRKALLAWSENTITGPLPETWNHFATRAQEAMNFAQAQSNHEHVLVISSGGAISMALKHLMAFNNETLINLNLQTRNSGVSEVYFNEHSSYLTSFNNVPHLDTKERRGFITSV